MPPSPLAAIHEEDSDLQPSSSLNNPEFLQQQQHQQRYLRPPQAPPAGRQQHRAQSAPTLNLTSQGKFSNLLSC